jgi:hypothetical protein
VEQTVLVSTHEIAGPIETAARFSLLGIRMKLRSVS